MSSEIRGISFLSMQKLLEEGGKIVNFATIGERIHDFTETTDWNDPVPKKKGGRGWELFYNGGERITKKDLKKDFDRVCAKFAPSEATHFHLGDAYRLDRVTRNLSWAIKEHYQKFVEAPVIYLKVNPKRSQYLS